MPLKELQAADVGIPVFEVATATEPDVFTLSSHARAHDALVLGLERAGAQYNVYVLGPDQAGRMTATRSYVESWARAHPPASDWLYLLDFDLPSTPLAVAVPAGQGTKVQATVERLLPQLARELAGTFASEAYQQQVVQLRSDADQELQNRTEALNADARHQGLALVPTPQGPMIAALNEEGQPVPLQTLSPEKQQQASAASTELQKQLAEINRDALRRQQQFVTQVEELGRQVARHATAGLIEAAAASFEALPEVARWFGRLAEDVVAHYELFLKAEEAVPTAAPERARGRYAVNLLVDRHQEEHRAVVVEQNPTYENLFGKIEYRQLPGGGLATDVSLIKAGSLHRANGGVLLLRASDLATQPAVWTYLKAALRDGEIRIEEFYRAGSPPLAGAPSPTPVPLDLTVILVGPPALYHLFFAADPDFSNYFKIKAHIEPVVDATSDNLAQFAGLLNAYAQSRGSTLDPSALQLLLGVAARWAGHRHRITTRFEAVCNLIEEACSDGCDIDRPLLERVMVERRRRNSHIEDEVHRAIQDQLTIITVDGASVGQINGLTVQNVGDHVFGTPARITARASVGRRGVINIERLVAMSGPIQQKGSLVLQGLLTRRFARHAPTAFDCSVTFEQLYGGVEGDSASLAEYIAIISDLADLPIRQDLAITGSVNQLGEAQVIGGVHHKIEGFFRVCREVGELTGSQGVLLPAANEQHLVLRDEVTQAMAEGRFHLYGIDHVDDAVALFCGMPVGSPAEPRDDTVYGRVVQTLQQFDAILAERQL